MRPPADVVVELLQACAFWMTADDESAEFIEVAKVKGPFRAECSHVKASPEKCRMFTEKSSGDKSLKRESMGSE